MVELKERLNENVLDALPKEKRELFEKKFGKIYDPFLENLPLENSKQN
jgi:hypothetical protein